MGERRAEIESGVVVGASEDDGILCFRGVPFAAPPTGDLRFRAPRPVTPWTGVRDATSYGPSAPQRRTGFRLLDTNIAEMSEDCLTVNVWTPSTVGSRPVFVWVHGGGFTVGSGASWLYRGHALAAAGDMVVVTINYRLGVLGYLSHSSLVDESTGACGNWGLLDQLAALRWVRTNIAAFGGDPARVTVVGESAGGMSAALLATLPEARDLVHRVVVQSGVPMAVEADIASELAEQVVRAAGVTRPSQLRSVPVEQLLTAQDRVLASQHYASIQLGPTIDGAIIRRSPFEALLTGAGDQVPMILGSNRDDASVFVAVLDRARRLQGATMSSGAARSPADVDVVDTSTLFERRVQRALEADASPKDARRVMAAYRDARAARGDDVDPRRLWIAIESDRLFRVPLLQLAEARAARGATTYSYLFDWRSPAFGGKLGACHGLEIPFLFGSVTSRSFGQRMAGTADHHEAAAALVVNMQAAWTSFASRGAPSLADGRAWPRYDSLRRATVVFGPETRIEDAPLDAERAYWSDRGWSVPARAS